MLQLRDARGLVCVMAAPRYVWNKYNPKKNGPRILMARVFFVLHLAIKNLIRDWHSFPFQLSSNRSWPLDTIEKSDWP